MLSTCLYSFPQWRKVILLSEYFGILSLIIFTNTVVSLSGHFLIENFIGEVVAKMDEDSDGVIRVEHVNKVKNYNKPITVYIVTFQYTKYFS